MGFVRFIRYETPGCVSSVVPNTSRASSSKSGRHTSLTCSAASMTPSGSRSATAVPGSNPPAASSVRSNAIGIGHSVPSAKRISARTRS